jgi:hypothetical protein
VRSRQISDTESEPLAASILLIGTLSYSPIRQEQLLKKDLVALLSEPPAPQIISSDRSELLRWSTGVLPEANLLPAQLDKVEFRGGSAVSVADHKAVFLKMKNEQRASLLIVDARLMNRVGIESMPEKTGSAALWSDQKRTYPTVRWQHAGDARLYGSNGYRCVTSQVIHSGSQVLISVQLAWARQDVKERESRDDGVVGWMTATAPRRHWCPV